MIDKVAIVPLACNSSKLKCGKSRFKMGWYLVHFKEGVTAANPLNNIVAGETGTINARELVPIDTITRIIVRLLSGPRPDLHLFLARMEDELGMFPISRRRRMRFGLMKQFLAQFLAPLLTQEKNRVRTAEEGHGTTFECIFMYLFLGLYIQRLFLVIVGTLLFQ
jgi:hypothetical protein